MLTKSEQLLQERYAYTELRKINWNEMRQRFLARVQALDAAKDMAGYYTLLHDLAGSIQDAHVQVSASYMLRGPWIASLGKLWGGRMGATVVHLTDGRFITTAVSPGSVADRAGIKVGTEIRKINGKTVPERLAEIPNLRYPGTPERAEKSRLPNLLAFPLGEKVALEFLRPGETTPTTVTVTSEDSDSPHAYSYPESTGQPFYYKFIGEGTIGYVRWESYEAPALNIAGWEHFLANMTGRPGMIIDMRGNGGRLLLLMYTMASYLFAETKPASTHWLDVYEFDDATKQFAKPPSQDSYMIHSPRPDLTYTGPVVVLVDGSSASAAEFFSQFLQKSGRAVVIADEGTDGAGGTLRQARMPGGMIFTYTGGRMFFAGTREVNIEGKGVTADVRVPTTEENERRKLGGEDVVLTTAIEYLKSRFPKEPAATP